MEWPPGHAAPVHVNDERDVLVVVLRGSAVVRVGGVGYERAAGGALIVERGAARQIVAGPDGATVLTAHRRRERLQVIRS